MVPEVGGSSPLRHPKRVSHPARSLTLMAEHSSAFPVIPPELRARAACWGELQRWERRELARELRALGLSYREISAIIPASKGSISNWCRDVSVSPEQAARLRALGPSPTQRAAMAARKRHRAAEVRSTRRAEATIEAIPLLTDASFVAGLVAYWSEGAKNGSGARFANSDPCLARLFIAWVERFLQTPRSRMRAYLNIHADQDEQACIGYWAHELGFSLEQFGKTFIKPDGTGHRKAILYHGTISIRLPGGGATLDRILGWIDALRTTCDPSTGEQIYSDPLPGR